MTTKRGFMDFFGPVVSKTKLAKMMADILMGLPKGTPNLKDSVVMKLGSLGSMCTTRNINDAWNQAKKMAARDNPSAFILDNKNALRWNERSAKAQDKDVQDKNISNLNYNKLNKLAKDEGMSVNDLISSLIKNYRKK